MSEEFKPIPPLRELLESKWALKAADGKRLTIRGLAKRAGVNHSTVIRACKGLPISRPCARKIVEATKKRVRYEDLVLGTEQL